jgi:2-iminobutanoate/2-iminopropanoate deaminase
MISGASDLKRVFAGRGLSLQNILSARTFLVHFENDYEAMNQVYASYFEVDKRPARTKT